MFSERHLIVQDRLLLWTSQFFTLTSIQDVFFSYDVDLALEAGKQASGNDGTLLNNPRVTSSILEKLAETIFGFTACSTGVQILAILAYVEKYPCLNGWQQRIKYKMGNYRAKLRGRQLAIPELEVNTLERQRSSEEGSLKGFKRPKKLKSTVCHHCHLVRVTKP